MSNIPSSPSNINPNLGQPSSVNSTATLRQPLNRSVSVSSSWASEPPHHHQGTSYFPPASPSTRRVSNRNNSMGRSVSVSSERQLEQVGDQGKDVSSDDALSPGDQDDVEGDSDTERQFNDEDPLTVKDRQSLMNVDHPFGLPIWKPALYKKSRSVNRYAETALHAMPSPQREHLYPGNIAWTFFFGWWLATVCTATGTLLFLIPFGGRRYSKVLLGLGWYLFWPFGKYVAGDVDKSNEEHERPVGDGFDNIHPIPEVDESNYDHDNTSFTPMNNSTSIHDRQPASERTRLKSSKPVKSYVHTYVPSQPLSLISKSPQDSLGWVIFWLIFICLIAPLMLTVCLICWFLVISVPMAKLNWELLRHIFAQSTDIRFCAAPVAVQIPPLDHQLRPPVEGHAESTGSESREQISISVKQTRLSAGQKAPSGPPSTILLCIYHAVGLQYYKYTVGGVNIFFVNLMAVVFFTIFDGLVLLHLKEQYGDQAPFILKLLTNRGLIFTLSLTSVIPLSYFIGMAVASISAQSSIGMGAVINATFGSIIEIILYAIALTQGKGRLVEGSIVGSLLAGVLLLPGASMCSGAVRKKEQKFNAKSAGVTSTMLIMAIIGTLTPTMFYQTYGSFQLVCDGCPASQEPSEPNWLCDHCYYEHPDPIDDPFYQSTVKTYMYFCAAILLLSYLIGLWFSLRTHASQIWQNPQQLMHPFDLSVPAVQGRTSIYQRLLPSTLIHPVHNQRFNQKGNASDLEGTILSRPETPVPRDMSGPIISQQASPSSTRRVAYTPVFSAPLMESVNHAIKSNSVQPSNFPESLAPDDFTRAVAVATVSALRHQQGHDHSPVRLRGLSISGIDGHDDSGAAAGHDAPSWSRTTSASVLLSCTALYALIAEILVDVVDVVLEKSGLDEKFLGVTLFALVPNTTEFMNAMSFAMNGNIALSMEIGSAYALQVCLLQIPAMVAFSAWYDPKRMGVVADTFTLIFPRWDVIAIILSIFLLTYTYIEAKSNYHRGSILILSYVVLTAGFYFAPHRSERLDQILLYLQQTAQRL